MSLLEIQFLIEVERVSLAPGQTLSNIAEDPRWTLDSPSSDVLFRAAFGLSWTRDPFDRLLVAHATCRRFRLATGDRVVQANFDGVLAL